MFNRQIDHRSIVRRSRKLLAFPFLTGRLILLMLWHALAGPPRILSYDKFTNAMLLRAFGASVSWDNARVHGPITLHSARGSFANLTIGENCVINGQNFFDLNDRITLESGCSIGPGVIIMTHNAFNGNPFLQKRLSRLAGSGPVTIGRGAGIKVNAVILHGVTIGEEAVVAGGAIVSRDIPDRAYVTGVPAVVKKLL